MPFRKIELADVKHFQLLIGERYVLQEDEDLQRCASDETENLVYLPEIILQPGSTREISTIMQYCNEHFIPVTPRGAGTGLSGGALPVMAGVVLDMKRLDKILNIDTRNFQVTAEPGVITQVLQEAVKADGVVLSS